MAERIDSYEKGGESKEKKNLSFDIKKALKELGKQVDRENSGSTSSKRGESSARQETMNDRQMRALGFDTSKKSINQELKREFENLHLDYNKLGHFEKFVEMNKMTGEPLPDMSTKFVFNKNLEKTDKNGFKYVEVNGKNFYEIECVDPKVYKGGGIIYKGKHITAKEMKSMKEPLYTYDPHTYGRTYYNRESHTLGIRNGTDFSGLQMGDRYIVSVNRKTYPGKIDYGEADTVWED